MAVAFERVRKVVIVGAGFGGLAAARALRGAPVEIVLIDRRNHHLFQPLLYQVATAGLSPANIASPIRGVLSGQRNVTVQLGEVIGIDREQRHVELEGRRVAYDDLILATGAGPSYFGHDEWARHAPTLKSIEDAIALRRNILMAFELAETETDDHIRRDLLTFVLIGGGPTGVELAGSIGELAHRVLAKDFRHINPRSARIILLEAAPGILRAFPPNLAEGATRALERLGVEVRTGAKVEDVRADGVVVNGELLRTRTVIWSAGVAASPAGKWLSAETDSAGRVKVNEDLSIPGHPEIFVIGDCAHVRRPDEDRPLPGVAPVAMQQGRYVARVLEHRATGAPTPKPFRYLDKGDLATVGRSYAIVRVGRLQLSGWIAWIAWLLVHVYYLITFKNRILVLLQWTWAYLRYYRGARLITDAVPCQRDEVAKATTDK